MNSGMNFEVVAVEDVPVGDVRHAGEKHRPVVLVVDDERSVADTLSIILSHAGFAALTAYSGKAALGIAMDVPPELLISDVAMPEMNGVELAMKLVDEIPECKVLLFSGHALSSDLVTARASGYRFPLLTKPLHPAELLEYVRECLEGDEAED